MFRTIRIAAAAAVAICWVCSVSVSAQVRLDNLVGDTSVCGARGDRVVECGSSNTKRPDTCCDGLMCSRRSGGNLHMRCWTPEEVATEDMEPGAVPPPAPVPAPTLAAAVAVAPPVGAVNGVCAGEGERSVQCGASFGRPPTCCQGFVCTPGNAKVTCTAMENLAPVSTTSATSTCAEEGDRAQACGADNPSRPWACCDGLICEEGAGVKCIPAPPPTTPPPPTMKPTPDPNFCAAVDGRSQSCGSANAAHPPKCCPGLICRINTSGVSRPICVEPPLGYIWPTMQPTPNPTMMPTTPVPTNRPTTYPPTMDFPDFLARTDEPTPAPVIDGGGTDEPTLINSDIEILDSTSSAFGLAVAYRSAAIGTVLIASAALLL